MRKLGRCLLGFALLGACARAGAQAIPPGGSRAQVEPLRGDGAFLQGFAWYDLDDPKGPTRDGEATKTLYSWNKQVGEDYQRDGTGAGDREPARRRLGDAARKAARAEREYRLRTKPTTDDIAKGDALNALLTDLASPTIQEASWRESRIELPDDVAVRTLAFDFATRPGLKENAALSRAVIAPGRLDLGGRWPEAFPAEALKAEVATYEATYRKVRDQCRAGRLEVAAVIELDQALKALKGRVAAVVPVDRGFRAEATKFVDGLIAAARMFDAATLIYTRELIADTSGHEAQTVGQLLAFMRKYRLLFARADATRGGEEMYARLYDLMKRQAVALDPYSKPVAGAGAPAASAPAGTPLVRPATRPYYYDDFNDPRSGWPTFEEFGYAQGVYFIHPSKGWAAWTCARPLRGDGTIEVRAIVRSREPFTQGAMEVHVTGPKTSSERGFAVKIDAKGHLYVNPARWDDAIPFRKVDPSIGPVIHPSIRPSGAGNALFLLVRKRSVDIYVNSARVCEPIRFDFDLTPATVALGGNDGPTPARVEFDSIEIRDIVRPGGN